MNLLDLVSSGQGAAWLTVDLFDLADPVPNPPARETPTTGQCVCGKKIWDPVSLAYKMGPDCRRKHGITPRRPVRVTGVEMWRDCEGQTDLFEEGS